MKVVKKMGEKFEYLKVVENKIPHTIYVNFTINKEPVHKMGLFT